MSAPRLYLASHSPRRRALLAQIGVAFEPLPVAVDEAAYPDETPADYVRRVALEKARAGWASLAQPARHPVLGADTAVILDGAVLGKPAGRAEALDMLARLSGRRHTVLSAVALVGAVERVVVNESHVSFRDITAAERAAYWDTGEPADKAGAYAIQGLGAVFVARLEGSYSGVMGLPLYETAALLAEMGFPVLARPADEDA